MSGPTPHKRYIDWRFFTWRDRCLFWIVSVCWLCSLFALPLLLVLTDQRRVIWPSVLTLLLAGGGWLVQALMQWHFAHRTKRCMSWEASGCCVTCGYDLRATPQRCPECGAVPPV